MRWKRQSGKAGPHEQVDIEDNILICPQCGEPLIKNALQNGDGRWHVIYTCACEVDQDLPIEVAAELIGCDLLFYNQVAQKAENVWSN